MEENTLIWAICCDQCKKPVRITSSWDNEIICPTCNIRLAPPQTADYLLMHCSACKQWQAIKNSEHRDFKCSCQQQPNLAGSALIDRYQLQEKIGSGLAGEVWKAIDTKSSDSDHQIVAIKFVKEGEGSQILRAEREAQALVKLNHPGIIHIYGYVRGPGFPISQNRTLAAFNFNQDTACIIMEYIPNDLARWLDGKNVSPQVLARLFVRIYDALQTIHDAGIIHRDLKLANILMAGTRPVITDFGLSRLIDATSITARGTIMGSLDYMAPEQARGMKADVRSDLYATGAMMWRILFDKPVFVGQSPLTQLRRIVRDPIPSDIEALPAGFQYILSKLLAKAPEIRFQSAWETQQALQQYLEHEQTQTASVASGTTAAHGPVKEEKSSIFVNPPGRSIKGTASRSISQGRRPRKITKALPLTKRRKRWPRQEFFQQLWLLLCLLLLLLILLSLYWLVS